MSWWLRISPFPIHNILKPFWEALRQIIQNLLRLPDLGLGQNTVGCDFLPLQLVFDEAHYQRHLVADGFGKHLEQQILGAAASRPLAWATGEENTKRTYGHVHVLYLAVPLHQSVGCDLDAELFMHLL